MNARRTSFEAKAAVILLALPSLLHAATVYDGYEAYYASMPNLLFRSRGVELQPYSVEGDESIRLGWSGAAAGKRLRLEIREGRLSLNGRTLRPRHTTVFPGEVMSETDLGMGATALVSGPWLCVENTPLSASGTAVRHRAVYLIRHDRKPYQAWKLPSLFATCAAVRRLDQAVYVDQATYRYPDGAEQPQGITFAEYRIQQGRFVATGVARAIAFVEPGNVYRFTADPQ